MLKYHKINKLKIDVRTDFLVRFIIYLSVSGIAIMNFKLIGRFQHGYRLKIIVSKISGGAFIDATLPKFYNF